LHGEDEARILRLIDQNKGEEARREILRLDEERRARQRATRRTPQSAKKRLTRKAKIEAATTNILRKVPFANVTTVSRNVGYMTDGELDFAMDATTDELRSKAVGPARSMAGKPFNPFWYH
jgi:hypothetical protein